MAIVNKLREKAGVAIGAITVGLALFLVGGDLLGPNSVLMGGNKQMIGEVDGVDIDIREFMTNMEAYKSEYKIIYNYNFNEGEMPYVRNQSWDRIVEQIAYSRQYKELGIKITPEELKDMVQGNNIVPEIASIFKNPQTGEVDRSAIVKFLQNLDNYPPEQRTAYYLLESGLTPKRLRQKYENLLMSTLFVTDAEAEARYMETNNKVEIKYLYVPFVALNDSSIQVTPDQIDAYYNKNKEDYKLKKAAVDLEYVSFDVKPSAQDSAAIRQDLEGIKSAFASTSTDSLFASGHSDDNKVLYSYTLPELPAAVTTEPLEKGKVLGPALDKGAYTLYKITNISEDSVYSMRASHILISVGRDATPEEKAKAKEEALEVLNEVKGGADFAKTAMEHGQDGTKLRGGDLGWFKEGRMVKPFEAAIMAANQEGLLPNLVETEFGYHVVKVTGLKTKKKCDLAVISKAVEPSEATLNEAYNLAGQFSLVKTKEEFAAKVDEQKGKIIRLEALDIAIDATNINNISGNIVREIALWAFNEETEVGQVSKVYEADNKNIVVLLKKRYEEGAAPLEKVHEQVTTDLRQELKTQKILEKLKGKTGSLDDIAKAFGEEARVITSTISQGAYALTGVGFAPTTVGKAFGLKQGQRTEAFREEKQGVLMVELLKEEKAAAVADYTQYKREVVQEATQYGSGKVMGAVKKLTNTKDNINKFY